MIYFFFLILKKKKRIYTTVERRLYELFFLELTETDEDGCPPPPSWVSLIAQLVKNPPAMQDPQVRFLGRADLLEKGKAAHSSILAWRIAWNV